MVETLERHHLAHKHLRAQTGQEGPRPRVDSPVSETIHHRLVKHVVSRSVFRKAGPPSRTFEPLVQWGSRLAAVSGFGVGLGVFR